jgi:hypothetical protein
MAKRSSRANFLHRIETVRCAGGTHRDTLDCCCLSCPFDPTIHFGHEIQLRIACYSYTCRTYCDFSYHQAPMGKIRDYNGYRIISY